MRPHPAAAWVTQQARNPAHGLEDRVGQSGFSSGIGRRSSPPCSAASSGPRECRCWAGRCGRRGPTPMPSGGGHRPAGVAGPDADLPAGSCGRCWPSTPTITTSTARTGALGQAPPLGAAEALVILPAGRVARRDRQGGPIHGYAQVTWQAPDSCIHSSARTSAWHATVGDRSGADDGVRRPRRPSGRPRRRSDPGRGRRGRGRPPPAGRTWW